jgi:phage terminase small subunit
MLPPKTLTGEGRKFWLRNAPTLERAGLLTEADRDSFALLSTTWGKLVQAEENNLDAIKFVALSKQCQNLMKAFGLTPESRKRLKIDLNPTPQDEFGL